MRSTLALLLVLGGLVGLTGCGSDPEAGDRPPQANRYEPDSDGGGIYNDDAHDEDAVAQEEWSAQYGEAWDEFISGYSDGWTTGCDIAFEESPDGYLYDQGDEYSADDCYGLEPFDASDAEVPFEVPLDPYAEGESLGMTDGCVAAFYELSSYGVLNWGEESYDESVCP